MIPMEQLPGSAQWRQNLDALRSHTGHVWIYGDLGTGVSTAARWLADQRTVAFLDDADRMDPNTLIAWIEANPWGVLGSHLSPGDPVAGAASRCLPFRLRTLEEDPQSIQRCLAFLAAAEGLEGPLPDALGALPCPGNLRGLHNRVVRWKLLGQLPDPVPEAGTGTTLPLETEDLAANLHVLERLLLHRALRRSYGNRMEAARRLGVSRRQLYLLVARHGDPVRGEPPSSEGPKRLQKHRQKTRDQARV